MAKKDDELDVVQDAADTKEEKKKRKKEKASEEESSGSKIISTLIVLVIILIWLGIFILAVKLDLGGFGSNVLAPVLKDVPVINRILPADAADDAQYQYDSMEDAVNRIKELEMELDSRNSTSGVDSNYIAELEAEIERLQVFEDQQEEFTKQKEEFDENVVYADQAPGLEAYKKYYEEMNPDNAAEIYRQVVEELQANQKVQAAADRYSQMEPASAAQILDQMTSADLDMVCDILAAMDPEQSALILQELDSNVAAKVTKRMLARN